MMGRKKKIRLIQFFLLFFGVLLIYFTYYNKDTESDQKLVSQEVKKLNVEDSSNEGDVFFDIEYSGLDLQGNRYLLKSEKAYVDDAKVEIIYMKNVDAKFYFKDNTTLFIVSDSGVYNNKTLDTYLSYAKNIVINSHVKNTSLLREVSKTFFGPQMNWNLFN